MTARRKEKAGGGVLVRRVDGEPHILLIHRRGVWDLPKGKLGAGETVEDCARREVCEELGIDRVHVLRPMGTTRHRYRENGRATEKTTWWYLMRTDAERFVPQSSEGIDAVAWATPEEALDLLGFDSLRDLVRRHTDLFQGS